MFTHQTRARGFTLVELMVTVAIASILLLIAVPSFTSFRRNAELTSVSNKVIASINAARGEAMKRGMSAFVAPLDNGTDWSVGWASFVDKSVARLGLYIAGAEGVVATERAVPTGITVTSNQAPPANGYIMFDASGYSRLKTGGFGALTMTVRRNVVNAADQPEQTRFIIISSTGRVRSCRPVSAFDPACDASSTD